MKGDTCKGCNTKFNNKKNYIKHVKSGHTRIIGMLGTKIDYELINQLSKKDRKDSTSWIAGMKTWFLEKKQREYLQNENKYYNKLKDFMNSFKGAS